MTTGALNTTVLVRSRRPEYNMAHPCAMQKADSRVTALYNFIKQVPLFAELTGAELESLAKDLMPRHFRQGETIFHQGDPGQMLYLIQSGQVRIYVMGDEGQEMSVVLDGPGDIFGELAVIDGLPRSASVVALEDTIVLTLGRELFREHMRRSPQFALNFMKALSVRVRYSTQQVGSRTFLDVPRRLARKLLELAQEHGVADAEGVRINAALTQTDLASLIGATRESINKAMGSLRKRGFVVMKGNHIVIVDPDALREIA